jgi:serine protease DegQ
MRLVLVCASLAILAPAARTDDPVPAKPAATPTMVPYRLSKTQHVVVRAKINGKGPFNFILDTGAPALFVSKKAAETAGIGAEKRGWTTFERFEVEGGVVIESAKGRVDDLFQLEGINGLGLAGVELHGVIGYNLLARYRIEYDFTRPKLAWTKLDYEPPDIGRIGGKSAPAGLEMIGGMMKVLGAMMGVKANFDVQPRGFLGAELADADAGPVVQSVLSGGPAAKAGLQVGDIVRRVEDTAIESTKDLSRLLSARAEGDVLKVTIRRAGAEKTIAIELGRGL